jgi:S-adenosylmethionine synthetase
MPKSVLITGATGLLGRQVVIAFEREGWIVTGTGYTRAKPPSILKVDLGSEAEIIKILDEAKLVVAFVSWLMFTNI